MYIAPNTTIKIYSGVPLDNTYENTIYFANSSAQATYFASKLKYTFDNNTYQRVEKGKIRIEKKADDLYDCDYLAFQNTNYGNKWFYAFITGVEYINNITSEISFEIDCMQTYMFDTTLLQSFVEREHSLTDEVGDNILPESVALGEYIVSDYDLIKSFNDYAFIVASVDENASVNGRIYDGIFSGAILKAFLSSDTSSLNTYLDSFIHHPEQVIAVYICPVEIINATIEIGGTILPATSEAVRHNIVLNSVSQESQDFGGYTPKNKKLYTYPYNFVRIDNAKGESLNLRYEFFDNLTPVVRIEGTITMPVQLVCRPCSYKGLPSYSTLGGYTSSKSECIKLDNYPLCSWNVDAYRRWASTKGVPILLSVLNRTIGGAFVGGGVGAGAGLLSSISNIISQQYQASIEADDCRGNISDGNVNVANRIQNFYKVRCHITKDYAEVIDNFFTKYGYTTNKLKVPNTHSRPHWNYVKTKGCNVIGNAPTDEIKKICTIFDNGITFWKNGSEVGDYSLNNEPV